jgi:hypothetical protein
MKSVKALFMVLLSAVLLMNGCSPGARYERLLRHELARGVRYDSLFLGLYLGMPEKDFYTHCWQLNKRGLIRQGEGNVSVQYEMKNELPFPALMNFYPKFSDGKISEMPVKYKYSGWSPWNRKLSSDSLQHELLNYYEKIYGKGFLIVSHRTYGNAYVKIDGNRRISIFKADELYVKVTFTDLLAKQDTGNTSQFRDIRDTLKNNDKK